MSVDQLGADDSRIMFLPVPASVAQPAPALAIPVRPLFVVADCAHVSNPWDEEGAAVRYISHDDTVLVRLLLCPACASLLDVRERWSDLQLGR